MTIPCKIMESIILDELSKHLQKLNIPNDHQHGFRKGRSCLRLLFVLPHLLQMLLFSHPVSKPCSFESFKPISPEQVLFLIGRAQSETSELDPVPTWLVKECAVILAPFFAYVFNDGLQKGHLSPEQKRAVIYPGLKKPSLNPDDLANYRPISNLSFVSKLLERAVHAHCSVTHVSK